MSDFPDLSCHSIHPSPISLPQWYFLRMPPSSEVLPQFSTGPTYNADNVAHQASCTYPSGPLGLLSLPFQSHWTPSHHRDQPCTKLAAVQLLLHLQKRKRPSSHKFLICLPMQLFSGMIQPPTLALTTSFWICRLSYKPC